MKDLRRASKLQMNDNWGRFEYISSATRDRLNIKIYNPLAGDLIFMIRRKKKPRLKTLKRLQSTYLSLGA